MKKIKKQTKIFAALLLAFLFVIPVSAAGIELVPLGHTAGIRVSSSGAIVIALSENMAENPCRAAGIAPGDVIQSVDGKEIATNRDLHDAVVKSGGKEITVEYLREGMKCTCAVTPKKNSEGEYAIGVLIRDGVAGIGTMTYFDPQTKTYGALGHGISDSDTSILIPAREGALLPSEVSDVVKGKAGTPGELRGEYDISHEFATIDKNTDSGIFGKVSDETALFLKNKSYAVADKSEIKRGAATILSNIEGDEVKEYEIEITAISKDGEKTKNMLISATDPELLSKTGGIVRGMSGSPILQNGKIVGAVTHVLVNDPTKGYAIFIENMLNAAE
ncbi:MAG: SpoIVB peptidase [Oscillospiraceae bacterium]|nr:SpoIVB peptidase [Oscillospiraceae bacterium]